MINYQPFARWTKHFNVQDFTAPSHINIPIFVRAVTQFMEDHDAFRMRFHEHNGEYCSI